MSDTQRPQGIPPLVQRLGAVSFFTDVASEMAYPLLPALLRSLGAGAGALGFMEGIAESVSALLKWWSGGVSDRARHRKPFVLFGYGVATFVRPLYAIVTSPIHVVLVRAADRMGKGVRAPARDALLAASVPKERLGVAFGFHQMMDNLGAVFGPLVAFTLARGFDVTPRRIFAATIVPGLISLFLVATLREPPREDRVVPEAVAPREAAPRLSTPVRRYLAVVALFTLGASADSFLLLRLGDLGLPAAWLPVAWLSLSASKAATNLPGGRLSDRMGRRGTQVAAWLVYAAVYALFPLTTSVALTWILFVAYGAYYGLAEGGEKAIVAELCQSSERGRAFGALHAVTGIAVLPANALFGALYTLHPAWAFGVSAACAASAALALLFTRDAPRAA